jgi:hypothetical protein
VSRLCMCTYALSLSGWTKAGVKQRRVYGTFLINFVPCGSRGGRRRTLFLSLPVVCVFASVERAHSLRARSSPTAACDVDKAFKLFLKLKNLPSEN